MVTALGTTILAMVLAGAVVHGWQEARTFDWNTVKPVSWLKRESMSGNTKVASAARDELLRRLIEYTRTLVKEGLSRSDINDVVEHALSIQADPNATWSPQWGEFVEYAWDEGEVTNEQITRYVRNAFQPGIQMTTRSRVRDGGVLPIRLDYAPCRTCLHTRFYAEFQVDSVRLGDSALPGSLLIKEPWHMSSVNRTTELKRLFVYGRPAGQELTVAYRIYVTDESTGPPAEIVAEWSAELTSNVTVVPYGTETVKAVLDDRLADAVRSAIVVRPILLGQDDDPFFLEQFLSIRPPPIDLAFNVILRTGTRQMKVGYLTAVRDKGVEEIITYPPVAPAFLTEAEVVDVLLQPSVRVAERSLEVTEFWLREVLIENVPVQLPSAASTASSVLDATPLRTLEPGEPVDYGPLAFQPDVWKEKGQSTMLLPWEGQHVVFLTTPGSFDHQLMARWVQRLDEGWALYADLTGGTPRPFKQLGGKVTIAAVPTFAYTCGAGCGYVGVTGIELAMFYQWNYPALQRNPDSMPHYVFYEMGRNYLTFGDRHSCFGTGFAVFMRYVCMDTLRCVDEDKATRETIDRAEERMQQSDMLFFPAFTNVAGLGEKAPRLKDANGRWIRPSCQPAIYASAMLRLRREHGGNEWVRAFFRELAQCPPAPPDTMDGARKQSWNWLVAASVAAGQDLTPVFVGDWRMPLADETRRDLAELDWRHPDLTAARVIWQVQPKWR